MTGDRFSEGCGDNREEEGGTEREGLIGGEPAVNAPNTILENLVEFT